MTGSCSWNLHRRWLRPLPVAAAAVIALAVSSIPLVGRDTGPLQIQGVVVDPLNAAVAGATVSLLTPLRDVLSTTRSDSRGVFRFEGLARGDYILLVKSSGFSERRLPLHLQHASITGVEVKLAFQLWGELVTVTASVGSAQQVASATQAVNVVERDAIRERAVAVLAQAVSEEVGVHLQRTSPTLGGIYVRGLTGNKVNVFVDGVRYSNSAQRGGINTFLDLVDPSGVEALEVLRGPSSSQYGSDAIGGSIQLVSRIPSFSPDGSPIVHGSSESHFSSADASFGSSFTASYGTRNLGILAGFAGRRINTLRPGGGIDSHAAVTRFLGLPSTVMGNDRLPDTGFTQYAGNLQIQWALTPLSQLALHYQRGQQDGGRRYDQLLGGDGNLIADLRNLMLDLGYVRYDRYLAGWFDQLALVYSFNSQREERVNQGGNGNPRSSINHEYERTTINGFQAHARKMIPRGSLLIGADYYRERIKAPSFGVNPVTQVSSIRRGRVPNGSRYDSGGIYVEHSLDAIPGRLKLVSSVRFSAASYRARASDSPIVGGEPLWPDDSARSESLTFRAGTVFNAGSGVSLFGSISGGFRAPHVTDLGTFGLTGSGYEVSAIEIAGLNGTVGSTADASAVSTGKAVEQVRSETSLNYEAGVRARSSRMFSQFAFFFNDVRDNITKQTLILPPGAVGISLAGQVITAQNKNGAVYVAAATNPVLVRTNFGDAWIRGIEHTLDFDLGSDRSLATVLTWIRATDPATRQPPAIEGGTPAPDAYVKFRWLPQEGRIRIEPFIHAAARQEHLSTLDLEDRRTGATRTRSGIRNFFLNGATVRGLVDNGPDGVPGTPDDLLRPTGETLVQVQDRVLGPGVSSAPMFTAVPGYITFNLRLGFRFWESHDIDLDLMNLGDRNYRGISWGMDAPGRGLIVRYRTRF